MMEWQQEQTYWHASAAPYRALVLTRFYTYGGKDYTAEIRDGSGFADWQNLFTTPDEAKAWCEQRIQEQRELNS